MLNDDNRIEMRNLVRNFIHKITLPSKEKPRAKNEKGTYTLIALYAP